MLCADPTQVLIVLCLGAVVGVIVTLFINNR